MVSVAAGMAAVGGKSWVYSIAPFCYARPFEQIRNDVCLNRLSVRLVGNGGGYAYGSMGATHHALEDYGVMLTLPAMRAYVPAFDADVEPMVRAMAGARCTGLSTSRPLRARGRIRGARRTRRGAGCRTDERA